ncbi:hypothetical protein PMAYCL1PPCAC_10167, partial [Pristionchus mayeri]
AVSASNEDVSRLYTTGYVNVKPLVHHHPDPFEHYTHVENDGYMSPYVSIQPPPASPRPTSYTKGRASTVHVHQETDVHVVLRPPREVAPPPPRDSRHDTDENTHISAPERITIQLDRPNDLFGPGPGLGLGGLGLGLGSIGIDDVVPIPCPGSLDSGVSEPPFPAPVAQPETTRHTSVSPEDLVRNFNELREQIISCYSDLKDADQLDTAGILLRQEILKPAADIILRDLTEMEAAARKKRPAPAPPVNGVQPQPAAPAADDVTPTARPVPKPRTTKPIAYLRPLQPSTAASGSSSGAATPVGDVAAAPSAAELEARFNALPESAVQLDPTTLKLSPEHSQLAKVLPSEDEDDDEVMTRL